jgi:septal ring-binding cell division protein DamX
MRPQGFAQSGGNLDDLGWNDMGHDLPRPTLAPVGEDGEVPVLSRTPLAGLSPISPVHDQQAEIEERFNAYSGTEDDGDEEGEEESVAVSYGSLTTASQPDIEANEEEEALELDEPVAPDPAPVLAVLQPEPVPAPKAAVEPLPVVQPAPVMQVMPKPSSKATAAEPRLRAEPSVKGKAAFTLRLDPARHLKLRLACAVTGKSAQQLVTRALDELLASMPELEAMAERAPVERASK